MATDGHKDMDEMAIFGVTHKFEPTPYIPKGCDQQGRVQDGKRAELVDDQSDSADHIVFPILITACIAFSVFIYLLFKVLA